MIGNLDSYYSRDSVITRFREGKGKGLTNFDDVIAKAENIKKFIMNQLTLNDQWDAIHYTSLNLIARVNIKHGQNTNIDEFIEGKILAAALKILKFSKDNIKDDYCSKLLKKPIYNEIFKRNSIQFVHLSQTMDRPIISGSLLGKGASHKVRYAFDLETGKMTAIRYSTSHKSKVDRLAKRTIPRELLEKKIPGIVEIYYINKDDPTNQLLELYDGSLSDFLEHKTISQSQIKSIVLNLAKTLQQIHELDYTPWDFKIDNVLYKNEGNALKTAICDLEDVKKTGEVGSITPQYSPIDAFNPFFHSDSTKINSWQLGYLILQLIEKSLNVNTIPWPNSFTVCEFLHKIQKLSKESNWDEIATLLSLEKSAVDENSDLGVLIENSSYYKNQLFEFQKHFSDMFAQLETKDHPLISIAKHLMDFDINKRWNMEETIQALELISDLDLETLDEISTDNDSSGTSSSRVNTGSTLSYHSEQGDLTM